MTTVPQPALATLSHDRFWESGWVYERKLDGQRCLAVRDANGSRLYSRSGRDVTVAFPELAEALERQAATSFVIDGEVVAFEGSRTSFARLQPRIHLSNSDRARATGIAVWFYVFDVLEIDGEDVRPEPLLDRKRRLKSLLGWNDPIRWTPHRVRAGEDWFAEICRRGWEGLIAKRADAPYVGGRTDHWLKFKCEAGQELVVVGWTEPTGSRVALGALLLAYYDRPATPRTSCTPARWAPASPTGCWPTSTRSCPGSRWTRQPCTRGKLPSAGVHWARPELVARGGLHRVDARRPAAAPALSRPADRQGRAGRRTGGPMTGTERRRRGRGVKAGQGDVPRDQRHTGDHQARRGALLRRRRGGDASAPAGTARQHATLSRRDRGTVVLREEGAGPLPGLRRDRRGQHLARTSAAGGRQ